MNNDEAPVKITMTFTLEKFEHDETGEPKLVETITGGDDLPTIKET